GAVGTAHLLTPEQLNRKIENVLHVSWGSYQDPNLLNPGGGNGFKMLFGGIDSVDTTVRIQDPNGIMANVIERMSLEVGCEVIGSEFSLPQAERVLFKNVEPTTEPLDANGYEIPEAAANIKANIVHLMSTLWGETYAVTDPEVTRAFELYVQTWQEGKALVNKDPEMGGLGTGFACGGNFTSNNYLTGVPFGPAAEGDKSPHIAWRGDGEGGVNDPLYTGRAWMAVMVYLLSDATFVYDL
ncbi:MAG: hypothetical protein HOV80_31075, partial [Polyangiaceae bacterium]|nr:hypothetical protein [Polyangiaceae bacterium]